MLKYLFKASFKDGTVIEQTQDDRSIFFEGKSQMYDVLQKEGLVFFTLRDSETCMDKYAVDLQSGCFYVSGTKIFLHDIREEFTDYQVIFFRGHKHDLNESGEELNHTIIYQLGWQANDANGQAVKRILYII